MNTNMENIIHYIGYEPFYIRAEKILERKFSGCSVLGIFQLCSIIRGFFILGDNSKCSATSNVKIVPPTSALGLRTVLGVVQVKTKQAVISTIYFIAYFILGWLRNHTASRFGGALVWHLRFDFQPVVSKYRRCTDTRLEVSVGEVFEMVLTATGFILISLLQRLNTSRFGGAIDEHLRFGFLYFMQFRSLV